MIRRLQEGDLDNGVLARVTNQAVEGLTESLFNDRIFWLESNFIENLDYDVRVTNIAHNRNSTQQFKCINSLFNVTGLSMTKDDKKKLLGQHFALQKMNTDRYLDNTQFKKNLTKKMTLDQESAQESEDLGVEDNLEDEIEA